MLKNIQNHFHNMTNVVVVDEVKPVVVIVFGF
jgi:hypothetical protein